MTTLKSNLIKAHAREEAIRINKIIEKIAEDFPFLEIPEEKIDDSFLFWQEFSLHLKYKLHPIKAYKEGSKVISTLRNS